MARFPHLEIQQVIEGRFKSKKGGGGEKERDPITLANLNNRVNHGQTLTANVNALTDYWATNAKARKEQNLPALPDPDVIPVFLQVDTEEFDTESLLSFGIEIIAEEENGFIIGASSDNFSSLKSKIDKFIKQEGLFKNKAAQLWQINDGIQWRVQEILSDGLREKWDQIDDNVQYIVDLGIACYKRISKQPEKKDDISEERHQRSLQRWQEKKERIEIERQDLEIKRQDEFDELVRGYGGEFLSSYVSFDDSFSCRIKISGKGLKDIVLNYQYLFEVTEYDELAISNSSTDQLENFDPELVAPPSGAPKVCIIDSGIQEEHRLIAPAIDASTSRSFIEGDVSKADISTSGGHGTRVAGAVLYPTSIPRNGRHQLHCFIQNARVLVQAGGNVSLPDYLYPPELMENIVNHFDGTRIFNLSINSYSPCKLTHMSQWASSIDKLMYENDVLFILSAGNISLLSGSPLRPGIREHIQAGRQYPNYLIDQGSSRIANPAQSCFALTVGSVCIVKFDDGLKESFGAKDDPSPFSRTGLGLWDMIKPDVVEYGGDFAKEKNANPNITNESSISPELVKSTYNGGNGIGKDSVGTSYAAPKVAHIVAHLQRLFPEESSNLYRALVVQSARLPGQMFLNPTLNSIRHYGYGIPDLHRAVENSEKRITLIASGEVSAKQANLYSIKVPTQLNRPGQDHDILIEVTLSFVARPRRTRRRTNSYLSTWLDWESSKLGENYDHFASRILKDMDEPEERPDDQNSIKWVIRERKDWSKINGVKRQDSSLQKAWCVMKSYDLPNAFSLAVIGHKGWESDLSEQVPYSIAVSFEALSGNVNVYEMIRVENQIELPVEAEAGIEVRV
jgi:hypothetical protein